MIIAIFGVTCVGKTTVGKLIAEKLQYEFFDLDREMISFYNDTILNIQRGCYADMLDTKKGQVLKHILSKCGNNAVIAMSPIYYTMKYKYLFRDNNVFSIVLYDSPENIAERITYTDDNDNPIENPGYDRKEEIRDIKYFISRYKKAFSRIESKYNIDGRDAETSANDIIANIIGPYINHHTENLCINNRYRSGVIEMDAHNEYRNEVTDYVADRAAAEDSIQAYYKQNLESKKTFREFIYEVVALHDDLFEQSINGEQIPTGDEEIKYVVEKTDIDSTDVVEHILWFCRCYSMKEGCNTWVETCQKCGCDELYEREVEGGGIDEIYFECVNCGEKYPDEYVFN